MSRYQRPFRWPSARAFASYASTACRTITWWDGSNYPLAACTLGVAPSPGSLVLTILGWISTRVRLVHPVAFQLNLLAALIAAITAGLVTWIGIRVGTHEGETPRGRKCAEASSRASSSHSR